MIIDAHAHMYHETYLQWLETEGGIQGRARARRLQEGIKRRPHTTNVSLRLEQLDRNGIDFQVVTPPAGGAISGFDDNPLATAMVINDGMARLMEESKGRLIAGAAVPLTAFEQGGIKEMDRAIKRLGLKAVTVPSHLEGRPPDVLESFWSQAARMDVPVYIHPVSPEKHIDRPYEGEYDLSRNFGWPFETMLSLSRLVFSGIMERYPTLKVVGHHLGGGIPFFWGRTNESYDLTNPAHSSVNEVIGRGLSKPLFDYFSLFYYDTAIGGSAAATRCACEVFGTDRLIFATDAPNGPGSGEVRLATYPGIIRSLDLSEQDTDKILAGNARRMLGLR